MKVTCKQGVFSNIAPDTLGKQLKDSELPPRKNSQRTHHRRHGSGPLLKKTGASSGRGSRPETPLVKWKVENGDCDFEDAKLLRNNYSSKKGAEVARVSARQLAAGFWRLRLLESGDGAVKGGLQHFENQLGFQRGVSHVGLPHRDGKSYENDMFQSLTPIPGTKNEFSSKNISYVMEGATKWDPVCLQSSEQVHIHSKVLGQKVSSASMVSSLEAELEQARAHIQELETDRQSAKKKLEHFLKKLGEQKAAWRSREHEKIRVFIEDIKADLNREKKNRQRMEFVNSKLVTELADAKLSTKRYMQDYEKERKARELIEEVCDDLAKEIGEDKAEVEALKKESLQLRDEVEDERKMLQMAEVWREERVQMKLVDAKVALEEKYSHMNKLVSDIEAFLKARSASPGLKDMKEAEMLRQTAATVNIQLIKEFSYEPPRSDDIYSVFEDVNFGEANEKEMEPCIAYSPASHISKIHAVSPDVSLINKDSFQRHSKTLISQNGDMEDDESGWETVSHLDDRRSSYSPEGSAPSVNKLFSGSETEWEEYIGRQTPTNETSEVCPAPKRQLKKVSSITKLWRSCPSNGENYKMVSVEGTNAGRLLNGRLSNGSILSPDRSSWKGAMSPSDMVGQWSSPDSGNNQMARGMKGCIEWPRGSHKHNLKSKLLEATVESQKVQLRHVLKQKT